MNNFKIKSIFIKTRQNIQLINPDEIVYCISKGRKVDIILISNEIIIATHSLKEIAEKLKSYRFLRCHAKCLVNLDFRLIYDSKNREIELINKQLITVAKDRKVIVNRLLKGKDEIPPRTNMKLYTILPGLCIILSGLYIKATGLMF
jgi:two-component system LytT family response regulator